jgi:hypothetical protein
MTDDWSLRPSEAKHACEPSDFSPARLPKLTKKLTG